MDLVTANQLSNDISILLGNGNGTFRAQVCYASSTGANSVVAQDFNGDGFVDLFTANNGGTVSVLLGNGNGSFRAQTSYPAFGLPNEVTVGNFNGDGIPDMLVANNSGSNLLSIYLGNGDASFKAQLSVQAVTGIRKAVSADVNNDGIPDILATYTDNDTIGVFLGNFQEGIGPQTEFSLTSRTSALSAMRQFEANLDRLSQQRATIGAFQSRISSAVVNLLTTTENYSAAESRIRDTDIGRESSEALRLNIVQQAASAVLAQANQQPAIALQILANR